MRKSCIVLGLLLACANRGYLPSTAQGEKVLEVRGALKYGPYALGRADLARLPRRTVRGVDPVTGRTASWEGVSVSALVVERVELAKGGADTAIVRTADRAAIPIPLTVIRQWRPVLADRADGEPLATPVLAWPTLEQRGIETDPRSEGWWARGVVAFELVDWQRAFAPSLAAPDGSPDAARRGSSFYADRCLRCHRVRSAGGERGPDLTTVTARLGLERFSSLLERHPGWKGPVGEPAGADAADELWSFLRVVAASPAVVPPPKPPEPVTAERAPPEPDSP